MKSKIVSRDKESLYRHYIVEKQIATRLKQSSREERIQIYKTMYNELFLKIPDHPRLQQKASEELTQYYNLNKISLVRRFVDPMSTFLEFAPGDCAFSYFVCDYFQRVVSVDISDQRGVLQDVQPNNLEFIEYDGFTLPGVKDESIDVVFSDQLLEHLHQDDVVSHFELAFRVLKRGGLYVFRTPHAFMGPHDISMFFSDKPEGFHIKEWTCVEIKQVVLSAGFSNVSFYWNKKNFMCSVSDFVIDMAERFFYKYRIKLIQRFLLPNVCCVAHK